MERKALVFCDSDWPWEARKSRPMGAKSILLEENTRSTVMSLAALETLIKLK
jgi:hypothetical protein